MGAKTVKAKGKGGKWPWQKWAEGAGSAAADYLLDNKNLTGKKTGSKTVKAKK